ncbi:MAG TPA: multicopper oxidase domain-containing protein [Gaiellaceae bacterium]|nr:multicopper oxidase domain-containing protein [Gaiellaceae bacterium]
MSQRTNRRGGRRRTSVGLALAFVVVLSVTAYGVLAVAGASAEAVQTRHYYIAADEVAWDYAPSGINQITGEPFGEEENVFVASGRDRIGKVYLKALYREYTDETFTSPEPRPPEWEHLGTLGPVIRAEVGDTIVVHFKNSTRFPVSAHPHGVFYEKDSEGAPYNDGTSGADKADDAVPPGGAHTYTWEVPERAGPGPNDPSTILWMYHSHTDEPADTNAGLIGPIIVGREGSLDADGKPTDVDRELVTMFTVFDENASPYLDANIQAYAGVPQSVDPEDEEFEESNLMHSINGFVYGNLPGLEMNEGEQVRWYMLGMGTEVDLHTPHWHGNTGTWAGMRSDVIELLPASMKVFDMTPDADGTWLFHCHVNDHISAGMLALFTVNP